MSDTMMTDDTPDGLSWLQAVLYSVLITAVCLAFAYFWEAIAQAIGDF